MDSRFNVLLRLYATEGNVIRNPVMSNRSQRLIVVMLSAIMLSGCWLDDDDEALADAGSALSIKERRSQTLSGASGSGEGAVSVAWSQISGPEMTISGADTLTPEITAPSVDADATAVLRLTVTDSKGQVATDDLTVSIVNNTLPVLTAQPDPVAEKTEVELTAALSDDGDITTISWLQTAGPEVVLSGDDTDTVVFTSPEVTEATTLSFMLTVTDDDDETAELELTVEVEPNLVAFTLAGSVSGADFSGGTAVLSGAYEEVSTEVDDNGAFSFDLQLDDDLIDSVVAVTVNSQTSSRLAYSSVYSGFTAPEVVATASVKSQTKDTKVNAASDGSNTVSVNAVSTALYSLLVSANGGAVPTNIEQLVFVEKSVDPQELIEAAAIVKIFTENPDLALPEGVTDLTALLIDVDAYNSVVEQINNDSPELINNTIAAIADDPVLTPPVAAESIPTLYFQISRAAPGFVARSGQRWQFGTDGSGSRTTESGAFAYDWALVDGKITVNYTDEFASSSFRTPFAGLAGLTQQQVDALFNDGIGQVQIISTTTSSQLQRITTGQAIDTFRIVSEVVDTMPPVNTNQGVITAPGSTFTSEASIIMRKIVNSAATPFSDAMMPGTWAMNSYLTKSLSFGEISNFYLDPLQFAADGTGVGLDTGRVFSWSITDGQLAIDFADGTGLIKQILDQVDDDFSVFTIATNSEGLVVGSDADYGFKVDPTASFTATNMVNPEGSYWQTTINQWTFSNWVDGRLVYCADNAIEGSGCAFNANNYFGWQINADNTGLRAFGSTGLPPELVFTPNLAADTLDVTLTEDATVSMQYNNCGFDQAQNCQIREWQLLKIKQGLLGRKIYVIEENFFRPTQESGFLLSIGTRMNMYEEIPYDYWNDSVQSVSTATATKQKQRKVLYPERSGAIAR
ncbi:hypothetical protein ABGI61_10510 [Rheinheimera sp. FR7-31]|uniref:PKD domain-containing protein n=1 Tax=Rheinheimera fenheensis TaxID=3152295 RepID=UPI00325ED355